MLPPPLTHCMELNLKERLTIRLGLTVLYFPIFRQARPDFFTEFYGNRCPTVASNERMKDANAVITLLEK